MLKIFFIIIHDRNVYHKFRHGELTDDPNQLQSERIVIQLNPTWHLSTPSPHAHGEDERPTPSGQPVCRRQFYTVLYAYGYIVSYGNNRICMLMLSILFLAWHMNVFGVCVWPEGISYGLIAICAILTKYLQSISKNTTLEIRTQQCWIWLSFFTLQTDSVITIMVISNSYL